MFGCWHVFMFVGLTPSLPHRHLSPVWDQMPQGGNKRGHTAAGPCVSYPTDKALRVPQGVQGRDVVFQDSPGTASTLGSKHIKVVLAAIGFAILLVKSCQRRREAKGSAPHLHLWPHNPCRVTRVGRIILPPANTHSS